MDCTDELKPRPGGGARVVTPAVTAHPALNETQSYDSDCFCNSYLGKTGRRSIPITTATTDAEWKGKAATSVLTVHSHGFDGMGKAKLSVRPRL